MLELNLCGLNCPLPVLKTKKFLVNLASGEQLTVLTTDPASQIDLQDFCRKTGNILLEQTQQATTITTIIQRR